MSKDWQESGLDALLKEVRENVTYDPSTGLFTWLKSGRGRFKRKGEVAGSPMEGRYVRINVGTFSGYAHRLVWLYVHGVYPKNQIDHINGNRLDNRLCNLREATFSQNRRNTIGVPSRRHSQFKGVSLRKGRHRFQAKIFADGRPISIGYYDTEIEAHEAYKDAAIRYYGEFAKW